MPSVTELAKATAGSSEGLVEWANRVGLEGKTLAQARSGGLSDGNRLHAELQRLVLGEPLLDAADDAVVTLAEWWSEASDGALGARAEVPLRAVVETPLGDVEVWGRADVVVDHPHGVVVWDAKVGRKPYVGVDNLLQVTIYQACVAASREASLLAGLRSRCRAGCCGCRRMARCGWWRRRTTPARRRRWCARWRSCGGCSRTCSAPRAAYVANTPTSDNPP